MQAHLLFLLGLGVNLGQQLGDLALLHTSVDVQDGFVACAEQRLVLQQVQQVQLGIKVGDSWHWQVATAEHKAWGDLILVDSSKPEAQVLASLGCLHLVVISVDGGYCHRHPAQQVHSSVW